MKADENRIDSLFRDKLEGMETDLSPEAREKMDHYIFRQRNRVIFRRLAVAAGLVIIMVNVFIFLKFNQTSRKEQVAGNVYKGQEKEIPRPADSLVKKQVKPKTVFSQTITKNQKGVKKQTKKAAINVTEHHIETATVVDSTKQDAEQEYINVLNLPEENAVAENSPKAEVIEKPSPVVIEYIVENKPGKTTKEKTGIAGLFEKAKEIGNEVSYGELRGWKDELFALNFIKSKKENNNSK